MSELILANIAAPFLLSKTGNIFIALSIIPVEILVILLFFKTSEITINFSRLFIAVLVANTATSILGIPLIFNSIIASSPGTALVVLPISFILSFLIESAIYGIFFQTKHIPRGKIILASFLSNFASYTIFFFALTGFKSNGDSPFFTPNPERVSWELRLVIRNSIHVQKDLYRNKHRFASNWEELGLTVKKEDKNLFHRYDSQGDATKASFTATSKREDLKSYRVTIFVKNKDKFIEGICETDKPSMTPPEMPKMVNGEFQCPPGSSDKSDKFGLRKL
jgi:Type IV pilin-like G and H, putative